MKRYLLLGLVSAIALTGCIRVTVSKQNFSSAQDLTFETNVVQRGEIASTLNFIEVDNRLGDINVQGADTTTTTWTWELKVKARDAASAAEAIRAAKCNAVVEGNKLRLGVTLPDTGSNYRYNDSTLKLTVPKSVSIKTRTAYGATHLANVGGNVESFGKSGSIDIRSVQGTVHAETSYDSLKVTDVGSAVLKNSSGLIEASNVRGPLNAETCYDTLRVRKIDGAVNLHNQSGRIDAEDIRGNADIKTSYDSLKIKNVSGNAILKDQSGSIDADHIGGTVKAETSYDSLHIDSTGPEIVCHNQSGAIVVHARSASLTNLEASTSYDSLDVYVARTLNPVVAARTSYAELESDFDVLLKPDGKNAFADVPASTPRIKLHNQSGRIRVRKD